MQILTRFILFVLPLIVFNNANSQVAAKNCSQRDSLQWVSTAAGCLHFYAFKNDSVSNRPDLIIVLHGDAPFNNPGYQYLMAKKLALQNKNSIAIGILRPGYTDPDGNLSDGKRGLTTGDNYTIENIDAIAEAIRHFKIMYHPGNTLLIGHSGGAAIAADIIALKPGLIDKAVIVSCPCDLGRWRNYMSMQQPKVAEWKDPVSSVSPVNVVNQIPKSTEVAVITGEKDDIAPTDLSVSFYHALKNNGIEAELVTVPDAGHEILLTDPVFAAVKMLLIK
jgi:predicted esterase